MLCKAVDFELKGLRIRSGSLSDQVCGERRTSRNAEVGEKLQRAGIAHDDVGVGIGALHSSRLPVLSAAVTPVTPV